MKICPNCKHQIKGIEVNCPNCGFELMTSDEAQELVDGLNELIDDLHSSVDMSPAGLKRTMTYVDNVLAAIDFYQDLLTAFFKEHEKAIKKPRLFQDKQWCLNVKSILMGMFAIVNGAENKKFSQKVLSERLPGCQGVRFELMKISNATEDLIRDYGNYIDRKDDNGMEKSKVSIAEISDRINNAISELDKVSRQITLSNGATHWS